MTVKNTGLGWSAIQIAGIIVIALGAAFFAYSIYNFFGTPRTQNLNLATSRLGGNNTQFCRVINGTQVCGPNVGTHPVNSTPEIISSNGNPGGTIRYAGNGTSFTLARIGDMLSGVLMVLLGIVTFMYGQLKTVSKAR